MQHYFTTCPTCGYKPHCPPPADPRLRPTHCAECNAYLGIQLGSRVCFVTQHYQGAFDAYTITGDQGFRAGVREPHLGGDAVCGIVIRITDLDLHVLECADGDDTIAGGVWLVPVHRAAPWCD